MLPVAALYAVQSGAQLQISAAAGFTFQAIAPHRARLPYHGIDAAHENQRRAGAGVSRQYGAPDFQEYGSTSRTLSDLRSQGSDVALYRLGVLLAPNRFASLCDRLYFVRREIHDRPCR